MSRVLGWNLALVLVVVSVAIAADDSKKLFRKEMDNNARIKELEDTDDFLIADAIVRRYGTRCKFVTINREIGRIECYSELTIEGYIWKSSGKTLTESVFAETFIDGHIATAKLMRKGIEKLPAE